MRISKTSRQFKKDYKKLKNSGRRDMGKLKALMKKLIYKEKLDEQYKDHALQGEMEGYRDCHLEGDWVLIYKIYLDKDNNEVILFHATDNHSNLFH